MGIDDESSHPELCSEVAGGVTRNIVSLFREPDAVTPPVRFDEREQETEPGQTGLRRAGRKPNPIATGKLTSLRLFSTLPQSTRCTKEMRNGSTVSRSEGRSRQDYCNLDNREWRSTRFGGESWCNLQVGYGRRSQE